MRQRLPVAVPAAVGGAAVAGCFLSGAYWREACFLRSLAQVFQRNQLLVPRLETKLPHPVDLHKRVVKLDVDKMMKRNRDE